MDVLQELDPEYWAGLVTNHQLLIDIGMVECEFLPTRIEVLIHESIAGMTLYYPGQKNTIVNANMPYYFGKLWTPTGYCCAYTIYSSSWHCDGLYLHFTAYNGYIIKSYTHDNSLTRDNDGYYVNEVLNCLRDDTVPFMEFRESSNPKVNYKIARRPKDWYPTDDYTYELGCVKFVDFIPPPKPLITAYKTQENYKEYVKLLTYRSSSTVPKYIKLDTMEDLIKKLRKGWTVFIKTPSTIA